MRRIALLAVLAGALLPTLAAAPAHAQAARTWVSGVGDDVNPCSRTAPCKTFAGAISKTAAAGEIDCLDPGGFGAVTITKSITISCGAQNGGILASGTNGIIINAGGSATIILKGVDIQGVGAALNGVRVLQAANVVIQDSVFSNLTGAGISFEAQSNARLVVNRVTITNAAGGGILLKPTSGVTTAAITNVIVNNSAFGISLDATGGAAGLNSEIRDSILSGNSGAGLQLTTTGNPIGTLATRLTASFNAVGLQASANSLLRVGESSITGNGTGVSGTVSSFGTNELIGNGSDGTLTLLSPALR